MLVKGPDDDADEFVVARHEYNSERIAWRGQAVSRMSWWSATVLFIAEDAQDVQFLRNCSYDDFAWAYCRKKLTAE